MNLATLADSLRENVHGNPAEAIARRLTELFRESVRRNARSSVDL